MKLFFNLISILILISTSNVFAGKWKGDVFFNKRGIEISDKGMKKHVYEWKGKSVYLYRFVDRGNPPKVEIGEDPGGKRQKWVISADELVKWYPDTDSSASEAEDDCQVCYAEYKKKKTSPMKLKCGKTMCKNCIKSWKETQRGVWTCPHWIGSIKMSLLPAN
ncbi:MAG: hypothetical protein DRQ88_00005 [Epsilonproteobacteria bacterium]|nr:MAG: hypothetical protein DRQ88_00005 [Campylobacterota bacterium]